jgi:hypothetical protein
VFPIDHLLELNKDQARKALEIYKRFVDESEKVVEFVQAARAVSGGVGFNLPEFNKVSHIFFWGGGHGCFWDNMSLDRVCICLLGTIVIN